MKNLFKILFLILLIFSTNSFAQFGRNKVQYKKFNYSFIQSEHFDVYFTQGGERLASFAAVVAESALVSIQKSFRFNINSRISFIIYNSHNDFQQTNVISEYMEEGIGGVTELFKNRIVVPFEGSYSQFRHVIHHELVHGVVNDMFYGGSLQSVISNNITLALPLWFNEGLAEYESLGWDSNTDMFMRDVSINENLPPIKYLSGYFAYRGGQAVWWYIAKKYGKEKVGEILNKIRGTGNFENGFKAALGFSVEELSEKWMKEQKVNYWPDIAIREEPADFAKKLTDHMKDGGFYNTSPAISPQGDRIAFISNRDDYFDVFLMSVADGKIITKIVKGNTTSNFEELHILTPGLTWSPDGKKIAIASKAGAFDAIFVIDIESEDMERLDVRLDGIFSVDWSPDGKQIAFVGLYNHQSDIYIYNLESKQTTNLTNDIFSDSEPAFSADGSAVYFSSDRGINTGKDTREYFLDMVNHDFYQEDIYRVDLNSKEIFRITDLTMSDEQFVVPTRNGMGLLFISDINGINNIYYKDISNIRFDESYSIMINSAEDIKPLTNSLNGLYQISLSSDGKKLAFSSMHKSAYNIFMMTNPLEKNLGISVLEPTKYFTEKMAKPIDSLITKEKTTTPTVVLQYGETIEISTGNVIDTATTFGQNVRGDFSNYIFNDKLITQEKINRDSIFFIGDRRDSEGNFIVSKYKTNFSPDIIYANAGYNTFYGLLGTTVLAFSDMMGDHQIIGITSLQIDLKNSDYGLAYYYLPNKIDHGIQGFHTARFLWQTSGGQYYWYRYRNYGFFYSMTYPIDKFHRIDGGLGWLNVKRDNLELLNEASQKLSLLIPSVSFVHDNSLWGYTSPARGTRYNFTLLGVPGFSKDALSFGTLTGDYRTYFKFFSDYSFTVRMSGGYSFGRNPQKFMLGGTDNWINRQFEQNEIPIESAEDFLFLTPALPLRGYNYAQRLGSKFGLLNLELHFPLIKYLVASPVPLLFQNIQGVAFFDIGGTWNNTRDFRGTIRNASGNIQMKDILMGMGFGTRIYFLGFMLKFDVAWNYDLQKFSDSKFYLSLGADL
ncbi:MAG: DPP IV N-terminal domain-containing protein [Bacteroidetes bacterium]|nr:DPP IV N-terminal domain-containing protein [Bacteroidota bacterium]MBU2585399.1 DPP IV N-terminal domain-containing protein [Bacteroidota bacterium]